MTNYDYYINEIMEYVGVDKKTGKVVYCHFDCKNCIFDDVKCCIDKTKKCTKKTWLESEYQPIVRADWSKVKIDTPIYVKAHWDDEWIPRYFAGYLDGDIYAWDDGKASFTTTSRKRWNYAKLGIDK